MRPVRELFQQGMCVRGVSEEDALGGQGAGRRQTLKASASMRLTMFG